MAMTTIRVAAGIRDRLAARVRARGRSLGAELSAMLDDLMWQGIEDGLPQARGRRGGVREHHIEVPADDRTGLKQVSYAMTEQVRALSGERAGR